MPFLSDFLTFFPHFSQISPISSFLLPTVFQILFVIELSFYKMCLYDSMGEKYEATCTSATKKGE
jgi:hypothetical protein